MPIATAVRKRRCEIRPHRIGTINSPFGGFEKVATPMSSAATTSEVPVWSQRNPRIETPGATYLNDQQK